MTEAPPPPSRRSQALILLDDDPARRPRPKQSPLAKDLPDQVLADALSGVGFDVRIAVGDTREAVSEGLVQTLTTAVPQDIVLVRLPARPHLELTDLDFLRNPAAHSPAFAIVFIADEIQLIETDPPEFGGPGRADLLQVPGTAVLTSVHVPGGRGIDQTLTEVVAEGIASGRASDGTGSITPFSLRVYAEARFEGSHLRPVLMGDARAEQVVLARLAPPDAPPRVRAAYDRFSAEARALLRRSSLLRPSEPLTPELAAVLLPEGADKAFSEVQQRGLLEGAEVRDFAAERYAAEEDPAARAAAEGRLAQWRLEHAAVRPRALTPDRWTTDDRLGYRIYAEAIAAFIRHPETKPPLTIGVKGRWGAGKTSLMRMVQELLDPGAAEGQPLGIRLTQGARGLVAPIADSSAPKEEVTNAEVLKHATRRPPEPPPTQTPPLPSVPVEATPRSEWRPTVWFNPWMYQSGEQVWAGLAHEIISQITNRLPRGDRERFWLELNLARIDREAVRRRAYRLVFGRLLPAALGLTVALVVAAIAAGLAALLPPIGDALRSAAAAIGAGGTLAALIAGAVRLTRFFRESAADTAFAKLVRQPDLLGGTVTELYTDPGYQQRTGFLHLVQTDMRRVLRLVATGERPLVVFVDDLDRCASGTVAQVIEAINLFLAGEFPDCVFILAMEPEVVAAHVEVAYKELLDKLGGAGLGWRFLEKIVQLPLSLPAVDDERQLPVYVRGLLGLDAAHPDELLGPIAPVTGLDLALVDRLEQTIRARRPTLTDLEQVAHVAQGELGVQAESGDVAGLVTETRMASDRIFEELYSDQRAFDAIEAALPALSADNPREIKRYVNIFRFYSFVSYRQSLIGRARPSDSALAKLAALAVRWPHLLTALAGECDDGDTVLMRLEAAANTGEHDPSWADALAQAGLDGAYLSLRELLTAKPEIGAIARHLL